jgi:heme/copper-type cytochrome/quinol oxidase subunit 4
VDRPLLNYPEWLAARRLRTAWWDGFGVGVVLTFVLTALAFAMVMP